MGRRSSLLVIAALLAACGAEAPAPLPTAAVPSVDARMVQTPRVLGYLARPLHPVADQLPAILLLAANLDDAAKAAARDAAMPGAAGPGAVVLAISSAVPEADARAYLDGMRGVAPPATVRHLHAEQGSVSGTAP